MGTAFSQMFPPDPTFTEVSLPDLRGKVFIVTGGASGIGTDLAAILYGAGGKVYIAGRSESKANETISQIHTKHTHSNAKQGGTLLFLALDLADLETIVPAAHAFQRAETRLDVLFNNAGVSLPPAGSVSAQGYELMMATNVLGPHLLTQSLLSTLEQTSGARVVWTTSQNAELAAPKGGFTMNRIRTPTRDQVYNYNASKIGNQLLSSELARRYGHDGAESGALSAAAGAVAAGVTSVVQNPGNVKTALLRHMPAWQRALVSPLLHSARSGAYTELYAGMSIDVRNGDYVIPWGRRHASVRRDLVAATKRVHEGGSGLSLEFQHWCDGCIEQYLVPGP